MPFTVQRAVYDPVLAYVQVALEVGNICPFPQLIDTEVAAVVLHDTFDESGTVPERGDIVIELQAGDVTGMISITAGSVLFEVITSFGLDTVAVLVRYVVEEVTRTGTVIVGNDAPIASASVRLQLNEVDQLDPVQDQPAPLGVAVRLTQAGSGSVTVVSELTSAHDPTFLTSIV